MSLLSLSFTYFKLFISTLLGYILLSIHLLTTSIFPKSLSLLLHLLIISTITTSATHTHLTINTNANGGVSLIHSSCPSGCECEHILERDDQRRYRSSSVFCHQGDLSQDHFFNIIRQIPANITTLDIEAPRERPNRLLWDDNLNRFKQLKVLRLVNSGIPAISRALKLHSLEVLDIRGNNIDHVSISMFSGVPSLRVLNLAENLLSVLPTGVFTYLRNMETLSLAYNNITELSASLLRGNERLESLHLDGNRISSAQLNDLFADVKQLKRLELNYCKLGSLSRLRLERIPRLSRLGLAGNRLGSVPSVIFRSLAHLNTLDLADNGILEITSQAFSASNIKHLFLAKNRLGHSPNAFHSNCFGGISLHELDLSYNNLQHFQSTILGRTSQASIETLHLSGNRIQHFDPKLTSNLIALKHLHLAENDIHQIPAQLPSEYAQLLFLNLSSNALQTFPDHARQLFPSLIRLDISNNLFSSFSISILHNFINHLDQVYLYNNPWDCGCLIDELKRHMSERYGYRWELRYEHARCATPEDLHGAFNESVLSSQQLGASSAIGTGIGYGIGVRIGGMTTAVPSNLDSPICALSSSTPRMPPPPPPPILATF
ncbi:unnamed protein product [Anisakis simplex]|uniref:Leucine-rich repeat-containing protein 15 n=1 Tax=Anisakis simplex TaxID=6269 RepID=A0A0M3JT10_ANISI|nr:unnamed protein product [Anisakis simplex]